MKVSVAFITYNHERFVAQALEGALMQDPAFDWEIVVGEDASTDRTGEIVSDYAERHSGRIRLLPAAPNLGPQRNFERVLAECRGEYIAVLEGDDYWTSPEKLRRQVEFLDGHPEFSLCFHNMRVIHEERDENGGFSNENMKDVLTTGDLFDSNPICTGSCMFVSRHFRKFPEWPDGILPLDWPMFLLISRHGPMKYIDEAMGVYRRNRDSLWSSKPEEWRILNTVRMFEALRPHLDRKFRRQVARRLSGYYLRLAELASPRDPRRARSCRWKALALSPGRTCRRLLGAV